MTVHVRKGIRDKKKRKECGKTWSSKAGKKSRGDKGGRDRSARKLRDTKKNRRGRKHW